MENNIELCDIEQMILPLLQRIMRMLPDKCEILTIVLQKELVGLYSDIGTEVYVLNGDIIEHEEYEHYNTNAN